MLGPWSRTLCEPGYGSTRRRCVVVLASGHVLSLFLHHVSANALQRIMAQDLETPAMPVQANTPQDLQELAARLEQHRVAYMRYTVLRHAVGVLRRFYRRYKHRQLVSLSTRGTRGEGGGGGGGGRAGMAPSCSFVSLEWKTTDQRCASACAADGSRQGNHHSVCVAVPHVSESSQVSCTRCGGGARNAPRCCHPQATIGAVRGAATGSVQTPHAHAPKLCPRC